MTFSLEIMKMIKDLQDKIQFLAEKAIENMGNNYRD